MPANAADNTAPILEIESISHGAESTLILDRIDWTIEPGQHWALLGPNGSGKTTLLRIASGWLWPNRGGTVRRLGQQRLDLRDLRKSIGWVSQNMIADIPRHERAWDTVVSGKLAQLGLKQFADYQATPEMFVMARDLMQRLGCGHLSDKPFGVLSQGEKQMVLVARACMAEPLLIILDEPCAGMDPGVRERFLWQLRDAMSGSHSPAMVFVTHHFEEIVPEITHALILREGRVHARGTTSEVLTAGHLADLYGVAVDRIVRHQGRYWPVFSSALAGQVGGAGG